MTNKLIEKWRAIILGDEKSWVLFENGTCVILMNPEDDLRQQAIDLMKAWGPVHAGASSGDFATIGLENEAGWVVTCHHNDILTYVDPAECRNEPSELAAGMLGRSKRDEDASVLSIIHVEAKRKAI